MMGRLFKAKVGMKLGVVVAAFFGPLFCAPLLVSERISRSALRKKKRDGNDYCASSGAEGAGAAPYLADR